MGSKFCCFKKVSRTEYRNALGKSKLTEKNKFVVQKKYFTFLFFFMFFAREKPRLKRSGFGLKFDRKEVKSHFILSAEREILSDFARLAALVWQPLRFSYLAVLQLGLPGRVLCSVPLLNDSYFSIFSPDLFIICWNCNYR